MNSIKVKLSSVRKDKTLNVPKYATPGAAGVDLQAFLDEDLVISPGQIVKIPTGMAIQLPHAGVGAFVFARSGLASKYGLSLVNGVGVIDSDYRGEVQVAIINQGAEPFVVKDGDRIAQMAFLPVLIGEFEVVDRLDDTSRGSGGFGSTGVARHF